VPGIGVITINNKPYNIAAVSEAYKVVEVPNHGDVDPKMERRVIWRNTSLGIQRRREDPSLDATSQKSSTFTYMRQVRNPEGIYWATGCDTTRQDRIFPQRWVGTSNFINICTPNDAPFTFVDGSIKSVAVTKNRVYTLVPPGTWALSVQLSNNSEISDAVQYGGQIYVAISPTSGAASAVGANTLTDSSANWIAGQFVGATLTMVNSTAIITSNTSTVLTFNGGWTGGTPALSTYQLTKGLWTWNQLSTGNWTQQPNTVAASYLVPIREQLWRALGASIYSTVNTDPTNQVWSGATIIGDPNTSITGLDVFKDFLVIFKQDGIYTADKTGAVYPIFPGFKTLGQNPRPIGQFQDQYLFAADVGLVWSYTARGGVRRIGFDFAEPYPMNPNDPNTKFSVPNVATRHGIPLTHYLVVGFSQYQPTSTSGSWFLAWDGNGWHPLRYDSAETTSAVGLTGGNSSPVNPILQMSHTHSDGSVDIVYIQNPLLDPFIAASFDPTPQDVYLPVDNGALEDEFKVIERVNVILDNPEAGTVKVAYALDEFIPTLTFQDMGEPQFQGTRGNQVFYPTFPLPSYNRILLKVTITAKTPVIQNVGASTAPAIRTIILHYKQRSPQRREWDITILAEENLIGAGGRLDTRKAKTIIRDLNQARIKHDQVTLIDVLNNPVNVYVDEVMEEIKVLKADLSPSYLVVVKLYENVDGR
jgi:hypothetical protein